mmetsp:Transcript_4071/g.15102  ORF Transcript_4071/g.15102 Transcript_4071/m.15102 type:complete len:317 (+) Transcript_4071:957-1907(+)
MRRGVRQVRGHQGSSRVVRQGEGGEQVEPGAEDAQNVSQAADDRRSPLLHRPRQLRQQAPQVQAPGQRGRRPDQSGGPRGGTGEKQVGLRRASRVGGCGEAAGGRECRREGREAPEQRRQRPRRVEATKGGGLLRGGRGRHARARSRGDETARYDRYDQAGSEGRGFETAGPRSRARARARDPDVPDPDARAAPHDRLRRPRRRWEDRGDTRAGRRRSAKKRIHGRPRRRSALRAPDHGGGDDSRGFEGVRGIPRRRGRPGGRDRRRKRSTRRVAPTSRRPQGHPRAKRIRAKRDCQKDDDDDRTGRRGGLRRVRG